MEGPPRVACLDTRHPRRFLALEQVLMRLPIYDRPSVRWAAVIGTYALRVAQVIFTPPSVEGGLVSPATTSADSATLARVDEFLMNCRRNFLELRLGEVRRIHLPRLYEKWSSGCASVL